MMAIEGNPPPDSPLQPLSNFPPPPEPVLPCPYSILGEFPGWWEWHRRVIFDKEDPNHVTWTMTGWMDEIMRRTSERIERSAMCSWEPMCVTPISYPEAEGPIQFKVRMR